MVVFWIRQRDFFQSENSEKGGSILSVSMCVCALWTCIIENLPFYKVRQSKQWKKTAFPNYWYSNSHDMSLHNHNFYSSPCLISFLRILCVSSIGITFKLSDHKAIHCQHRVVWPSIFASRDTDCKIRF